MSPVRRINGITFSFLQAINSFVFLPLSEIRKVQIMKKWIVLFLLLEGVVGYAVEYKTRLVVGITIDQFYPEWLTMYRNDL
ncbi:MAG: alkaline phosphatase family protein, partial [Odoribacter sp.]|nr:alkaline phosphatase family protein [Odoribacter sp.]